MSSFSYVHLITWMFYICAESPSSIDIGHELTNFEVELHFNSQEQFPHVLSVILRSTNRIIELDFTKHECNYNLPVYARSKDGKKILLDTPPITNVSFYVDETYDASVTLHCEINDHFYDKLNSCKERLIYGFFNLDGYRHMIEPKKRLLKRFVVGSPQDLHKRSIKRHQVFRIHGTNKNCCIKDDSRLSSNCIETCPWNNKKDGNVTLSRISPPKNNFRTQEIVGHHKGNGTKTKNTIEVIALITPKSSLNEEEINDQKIYYMHVFWGVNNIYKTIDLENISFEVKLIGFIVEPPDSFLYYGQKKNGWSEAYHILVDLSSLKRKHLCDHLTMFSINKFCLKECEPKKIYAGLTWWGTMCSTNSVSVIRKRGFFEEISVLAHEIGHSLGSRHDGMNNSCPFQNGYVMAQKYVDQTKKQRENHDKFSNCTIYYLREHMKKLNSWGNCLLTRIKKELLPKITKMPIGQLYSADEQCRANSEYEGSCQDPPYRKIPTFCLMIDCQKKDKDGCGSVLTAYKTSCGNKKWCVFGECVYDAKAPSAAAKLKSLLLPIALAVLHLFQSESYFVT